MFSGVRSSHALMSLLFISWLMALLCLPSRAAAQPSAPMALGSYSCGSPGSGHCYGTFHEFATGGRFYDGSQTNIDVNFSYSNGGFVTNEMWLADLGDTAKCFIAAPFIGGDACWIEAGFDFDGTSRALQVQGTTYFWADVRPQSGSCFPFCTISIHHVSSVLSTDANSKAQFSIYYIGNNTWNVRASIVSGLHPRLVFQQQSTNNSMVASRIDIGEELEGSGIAGVTTSSPKTTFDNNMTLYFGNPQWSYFTLASSATSAQNPPWAGWNQNRTPTTFGHGGEWYACVRQPSRQDVNPC